MIYNYQQLLTDYGVQFYPKVNHRGFLPVHCPFCGGGKMYGGINIRKNYYSCWKCRFHPIDDYVYSTIGIEWFKVRDYYLLDSYQYQIREEKNVVEKIELPFRTGPLNDQARRYLLQRGFDPDQLVENYNIMSTDHLGDYKFRVIIPIYNKNKLVSYTSRDYTGKSELRYYSCNSKNEIINHKELLYGYDKANSDFVIVVEGPIDKWKMGLDCVSTFGIGYKKEQVSLLLKYKRIIFLFDNEPNAQAMAREMGNELVCAGKQVENIVLKINDPGDLKQSEVDYLLKKLKDSN